MTETIWPAKPKMFTLWPFIGKGDPVLGHCGSHRARNTHRGVSSCRTAPQGTVTSSGPRPRPVTSLSPRRQAPALRTQPPAAVTGHRREDPRVGGGKQAWQSAGRLLRKAPKPVGFPPHGAQLTTDTSRNDPAEGPSRLRSARAPDRQACTACAVSSDLHADVHRVLSPHPAQLSRT